MCGDSVHLARTKPRSSGIAAQVLFSTHAPVTSALVTMDDATPVQPLKTRLLQLRADELAAKRALDAEVRATKNRSTSRAATGFSHLEENVALSLVVKQNSTYNAAVTYLVRMQDLSHHKFMEPRSRDDLLQVLRARCEALPFGIVQLLSTPVGAYWLKVSGAADKFIDEFKVRAWIIEQNVVKGLAPPSSEVGTFYDEAILGSHAVPIPAPSRSDRQSSKNRSWIYRFRSRWCISIGKVNTRDIVEPEEIHQKVMDFGNLVECVFFAIFGPRIRIS